MFQEILVLVLCGVFFVTQTSFAEISSDDILDEIKSLRGQIAQQGQRINELEERLAREESIPKTIQFADGTIEDLDKYILGGLKISGGLAFIVQGTNNANGDDFLNKGNDVTDSSYSMDLEFEKEFEDYGMAFIHLETGNGEGVEDELKVFSNVNRDADDSGNSVALTEAWYEHYFRDVPLTLTFGKVDPTGYVDTNKYANDECGQFLGRIFRNSPTIEFCDNSGGLHVGLAPSDFVELDLIALDADSDWEDMGDGAFFGAQLNLKPDLFEKNGNYRVVGWLDDRDHTKWKNSAKNKEEGYGIGISFDQELTDNLGVFLRYGWQDPDVYLNGESFSLEHAWSTGIQFAGSLCGREEDVLGLAVGQAIPSDEYKKASSNLKAEDEGHLRHIIITR